MTTQLYKKLKDGTTLYVLPGAAEDLNASYQNTNVRMTYSKFVLLRLPARRVPLSSNVNAKHVFDIENNPDIHQATTVKAPSTWGEAVVESLRNYVANHEATIRATRFNQTEYLYNTDELRTTSERIFWKWLRKNGAMEFEPALPNEEWDPASAKFAPSDSRIDYLQKYLWRERQVEPYLILPIAGAPGAVSVVRNGANLDITFERTTNFVPGDFLKFYNLTEGLTEGATRKVLSVTTSAGDDASINDTVSIEWPNQTPEPVAITGKVPQVLLDYDRVVQYVGEITAQNNASGAVSSYTEVMAHVPGQSGRTHSVLFDVIADSNYRPNMEFPILPEQFQYEINGAENPLSPIVANMFDYPGDYVGQFDTEDSTYTTGAGDFGRRNGAYYGIGDQVVDRGSIPYTGDISRPMSFPEFDGRNLDGVSINFDLQDYLLAEGSNSFSEFSASSVNDRAPQDYEFNAVLWYYDMEDVGGGTRDKVTNLYGIQFMDNPDRESLDAQTREIIPVLRKQVANGLQDGTAFSLAMDLTFQVDSEDSPMAYDPDRVYSLYGFELYSEVMGRIATLTDTYQKTLAQVTGQRTEVENLRGLIYSQQSIEGLRQQIKNLQELLKLYSTVQIGASDSIVPRIDASQNPPVVRLDSVDKRYSKVVQIDSRELFTISTLTGNVAKYVTRPLDITFPAGKDFLVVVNNNDIDINDYQDTTSRLELTLDKDLDYKQTAEFLIKPSDVARANKQLEVYVKYDDTTGISSQLLFGPLDLPVSVLPDGSLSEPSAIVSGKPTYAPYAVYYKFLGGTDYNLVLDFNSDLTHIKQNARLFLDNMNVSATPEVSDELMVNHSGQYSVSSNPVYLPSPIVHAEIIANGYANSTADKTSAYHTVIKSPATAAVVNTTPGYTTPADCIISWKLKNDYSVDQDSIVILQAGNGFRTDDGAVLEVPLTVKTETGSPSFTWDGTPPTVRVVPQTRTRVSLKFSSDVLTLAMYDSGTAAPQTMRTALPFLHTMPYISFNRGYRVLVTRYNGQADIVPGRKFERYSVNIERL